MKDIEYLRQRLERAEELLRIAAAHAEHSDACPARQFRQRNKYLPATHPGWKAAPVCNCWVSSVKSFIEP